MYKTILIVALYLNTSFVSAQKDSVILNVRSERTDSASVSKLFLAIDFISDYNSPIKIISETSLGEFRCNYNAAVWVRFERLNGACFEEQGWDCNVPIYLEKPKKFRDIKYNDTVSYKFEISNSITTKKGKFVGQYRVKIFHSYLLSNAVRQIESNWMYLDFSKL